MKKILATILLLVLAAPAAAQSTATPVVPGANTTSGCPGNRTPCWLPNSASNPVYVTPSSGGSATVVTQDPWVAVAGTQRALSIASATALTIPATATFAVIQAQGTNNTSGVCLYWQDDGTNPTNAAGQQMSAGQSLVYNVSTLPIKLIAASGATCTATISYYKAL